MTEDVDEEFDDVELVDRNKKTSGKPSDDEAMAQELQQGHSKNRMVRSSHRVLFKNEVPMRNDLFAKGRMAYVVEFEEKETDIPTTLLRSLHAQSIQANSLIISKLAHVFSYLRSEPKKKRKDEFRTPALPTSSGGASSGAKGDSIYDILDEYVPSRKARDLRDSIDSRDQRDHRDRRRDRSRTISKKSSGEGIG